MIRSITGAGYHTDGDRLKSHPGTLRPAKRALLLLDFLVELNGWPVAMLGFSTAAWKLAPRDKFIGWTPQLREKNLPLPWSTTRGS